MIIYGKNGRPDMLAIGQKSGMVWALNPDTGAAVPSIQVTLLLGQVVEMRTSLESSQGVMLKMMGCSS